MIAAEEALARLKKGNRDFVTLRSHERDLSLERIEQLYEYGQSPFAVVVTCSDSRTVPEHMFMMGLGDLFVVRVAGNVIGSVELASVVYACEHLEVNLVLVLGHTGCGAIQASFDAADRPSPAANASKAFSRGSAKECVDVMAPLTDSILRAVGDERDPYKASVKNVRAGIETLQACDEIKACMERGLLVAGGIYHTHSGKVDFLVCDKHVA